MQHVKLLQNINCHNDLLRLSDDEKNQLCAEIREFLIEHVSQTGGHLAGNLGVVELTVALETVYDTHKDRLVFDVGHQAYVHKLLTGRRDTFSTLRQFGGISGFPRPCESECDSFVAGHASSSVSIALGMARARTMMHQDYQVAALIGDGATTGGMAYEGMNNAADSKEPIVIILNDNEMSIGKNVGGISRHLSRLRSSENYLGTKRRYRRVMMQIPGGKTVYHFSSRIKNRIKRFLLQTTVFENMGLKYLGPVDGHDLQELIAVLRVAKEMQEPVLVHVVTKKGCGYPPAEEDPAKFHGIGKFDPLTGKTLAPKVRTFSDEFGAALTELAKQKPELCAITAAMPGGTGLLPFMVQYPQRFFDVGIAEEHAVSMAGGLAKQGAIPVVALYSTFLQRSYDQIMQDIAMLHLHVVFAIDRAGLVGDDGPTHHGVFDVGFLGQIPGMLILAPASLQEQRDMLAWAVMSYDGPVAIRYPRGTEGSYTASGWKTNAVLSEQSGVIQHRKGADVTLLSYGTMINSVMEAAQRLAEENIHVSVLRLTKLTDYSINEIMPHLSGQKPLIVLEETTSGSGIKEKLSWQLHSINPDIPVYGKDLGTGFVPHGDQKKLYTYCGLDAQSIAEYTKEVLRNEE